MVSAVRLRNRFWLQMKRSFWGWFIGLPLLAEFDTAQPQRLRNNPGYAVENIGMKAGAWNRTDDLHGFGDNQTNQNEEWARESPVNPPATPPNPFPVSRPPLCTRPQLKWRHSANNQCASGG